MSVGRVWPLANSATATTPTRHHPKILPLESLRGLLAVWVLAAHVAGRSLLDSQIAAARLNALTEPLLPVYVFMILSGFVIFLLLDNEREGYLPFLLRRFFRLAPLYYVILAISVFLLGLQLHALESLPWKNRVVAESLAIHREAVANFWPHLWLHLTLLQGLVPDALLRDANFTFISHGWSVSLEWQFYLVAPLLFYLLLAQRYAYCGALCVGVIALKLLLSAGVGYLPNQIHYFLAGIASYYLFFLADKKYAVEGFRHDALMVSFTAILIVSAPSPWPWVIWLWAFDLILMQKVGATSTLTRLTSRVLAWRPFLFLGKISYSIYLFHVPIL